MARILSVEIGNSITRISEMDFRVKNPKLYKYFCIPTPKGVLEDGFIRENPDFVAAIKRALSENKIKTKQVVFTVTSSKIITREVNMPAIKTNQVGAYVKANANDYFPIDLSAYEIAHVVLGVESGEDGKDKMRVMAIAAGKDLILGYSKFASLCGLRLVSMDYAGNSIYQIMKSECTNQTKLVIKMEDTSTIASVISNGNLMLQRNIANGFEKALQAYEDSADSYELKPGEAFAAMCKKSYIKPALSDRTKLIEHDDVYNESEEAAETRRRITATFGQLIGNLSRVAELYNSKNGGNPITEVTLVGMGAEIAGLTKLITNELGLPVKTVRNFSCVSTFQTFDSESMGKYVSALGAAIEPVDLMTVESKAKGGGKNINWGLCTVILSVIGLAACVGLVLSSYLPYLKAQKEEARLKALEAQYAEAEVVHNQYLAVTALYNEVKNKYSMTAHSNDELVAFLRELENKLPSDIVISEFTSNAEGCIMVFNVTDLEEAGKVLQILRGFESVLDVAAPSIDEVFDIRMGSYEFEVECFYMPVEIFEAAPAADAAAPGTTPAAE